MSRVKFKDDKGYKIIVIILVFAYMDILVSICGKKKKRHIANTKLMYETKMTNIINIGGVFNNFH